MNFSMAEMFRHFGLFDQKRFFGQKYSFQLKDALFLSANILPEIKPKLCISAKRPNFSHFQPSAKIDPFAISLSLEFNE